MRKIIFLGLFFFALVNFVWAEEIKIAVLPFDIHAPTDLSYVKEGIQDMLSTRLFVPGKTIIIDEVEVRRALSSVRGPLNEAKVRELGQKLGADFVIYGSVTTFGQKASLDAKLVPITENRPPLALYTDAESLDDFIPKLSEFAQKAVAYIEGVPLTVASLPPATPQAPPAQAPPAPTPARVQAPAPPAPPAPPAVQVPPPPQAVSPPPSNPAKEHPERFFREQQAAMQAQARVAPPPPPAQEKNQVKASKYRYSDIDPWPDYPPEEDELAPIVQESPQKKKKKKGKSFWSKLWPGNWFGGDKEEEVIVTPQGSVPPPPPPPTASYPAHQPSQTASRPQYPEPLSTPPPSSPSYQPAPAPSQGTWQWY